MWHTYVCFHTGVHARLWDSTFQETLAPSTGLWNGPITSSQDIVTPGLCSKTKLAIYCMLALLWTAA